MRQWELDNSKLGSTQQWKTLTCCQDHILTENIWFVWSETSYSGDERRRYRCGTTKQLKIELLSQWKLEAEFRKLTSNSGNKWPPPSFGKNYHNVDLSYIDRVVVTWSECCGIWAKWAECKSQKAARFCSIYNCTPWRKELLAELTTFEFQQMHLNWSYLTYSFYSLVHLCMHMSLLFHQKRSLEGRSHEVAMDRPTSRSRSRSTTTR